MSRGSHSFGYARKAPALGLMAEDDGSIDADFTAYLARGTALGYSLPPAANQYAMNRLIKALKSSGYWAKMDIGYILAGSNTDFATINIKAPSSYQLTKVNSPGYSSLLGFSGDGVSKHLSTGWNASTNGSQYTQNSASLAFWVTRAAVDANSAITGLSTTRNRVSNRSGDPQRINSDTNNTLFSNSGGIGYRGFSRTSSTSVQCHDGSSAITQTLNSTGVHNDTQFLLRSGTAYGNLDIGFAAFGSNLAGLDTTIAGILSQYMASIV